MTTNSDHPQAWEVALEASAERLARRPKRKVSRIQLAVFLAYGGNEDLYLMRQRPDPDMFDGAWGSISSLLQQMGTAESGLASAKYRADVEGEVQQLTEDDATRDLLRVLILNRKK
jgi:hypothetical protein